MPLQDSLDSVQTLTAEIGVFEVVLHIVNMPYALYLVTELINVSIYIHEETIMGVFCSQREIMVLLWLQVFATLYLEHSEMIPVEEQFLDAGRTIAHGVVGTYCPMLIRRIFNCNLWHIHKSERLREVSAHACRQHPMLVCRPFILQEVFRLVQCPSGHLTVYKSVAGEFIRSMFHSKYDAVSAKVGTCQCETWLEYFTLVHLLAFIDTLVPFETVVEIVVYAKVYGKPVFYIIFRLNACHEVATLREGHVLYQVV